uniref:Uncharacterized protein n=1 Tax=Arion vulgaris TaxID=1028688 RepID=A0A0B6ZJ42_9EUPU
MNENYLALMYSTFLLLLVIQAWTLSGAVAHMSSHEDGGQTLDTDTLNLDKLSQSNNNSDHNNSTPHQRPTTLPVIRFTSQRNETEKYRNSNKHKKFYFQQDTMNKATDYFARERNRKHHHIRRTIRSKRIKRATSKFTGLVVGATKDNTLKQSVMKTLNSIETVIWSLQSQFSKPFIAKSLGSSVLLGTFNSDFKTNFHGYNIESNLRLSKEYSLIDMNSLTTLLILQCLSEASLYGIAAAPAVSNMSTAVESLNAFYTHTYNRGSSILTMWPEKLHATGKEWSHYPENIIGAQVKDGTTFNQLQLLAKSCNCEPAKSGLQKMEENKLCRDYFATPLSDIFKNPATPPDFLTSFSNFAFGSLLHVKFPAKNSGIFKVESGQWRSANSEVKILIDKLKSMVIILPLEIQKSPITTSLPKINTTAAEDISINNIVKYSTTESDTSKNGIAKNDTDKNNTSKYGSSETDTPKNNTHINDTLINDTQKSVISETTKFENGTSSQNSSQIATSNLDNNNTNPTTKYNTSDDIGLSRQPRATLLSSIDEQSNISSENATPNDQVRESPFQDDISTPYTYVGETIFFTPTVPTTNITTVAIPVATTTPVNTPPTATTTAKETTVLPTPILNTRGVNQILNSESYFALKNYLNFALREEKVEVILIPSLLTDNNISKHNDGHIWHNGQLYPSYNNVNLMTTATTLHALLAASVSGLIDFKDDIMLQRIIVSSLRMLTWYMNNTQEVVTMVTLSQFPSRYQLYWITAKIAFQLNTKQARTTKMFQFAENVVEPFVRVLRDKMTFSILQSITDDGLGQDGKTRVYIDDFIGIADVDDKGNKQVNGDDRIFSSAMAINALIATWTVQHDNGMLEFVKDSGDPVRIAINSLANYISGAVSDPSAHNLNAFMSDQIKNCETMPARYPANVITSVNGKEVNPIAPSIDLKFGVKGYIPKEEYQQLLDNARFGYTIRGGTLEDLNSPTSVFRFWSSTAYTKLLLFWQSLKLQIYRLK